MFAEKFLLAPVRGAFRALCCLPMGVVAFVLLTLGTAGAQSKSGALPPGVVLPAKGGIYALQPGQDGNELTRLHATEIISNSHAASNFARSMVYAGPHSSVELDGINAAIHLSSAKLRFLVRLSDDSPDLMRERVTLVRLRQNEQHRVVSSYSQNIFGGQHRRQYDVVEVSKADVGDENASWAMITPVQPLPPGEYGIIFLPKDPNFFSSEVYDFNVDFEKAKPDATTAR